MGTFKPVPTESLYDFISDFLKLCKILELIWFVVAYIYNEEAVISSLSIFSSVLEGPKFDQNFPQ